QPPRAGPSRPRGPGVRAGGGGGSEASRGSSRPGPDTPRRPAPASGPPRGREGARDRAGERGRARARARDRGRAPAVIRAAGLALLVAAICVTSRAQEPPPLDARELASSHVAPERRAAI